MSEVMATLKSSNPSRAEYRGECRQRCQNISVRTIQPPIAHERLTRKWTNLAITVEQEDV